MTVSISLQMNGDFENQKHRDIAHELCEAVKNVLDSHKDDFTYEPNTYVEETKQTYAKRNFVRFPEYEPTPWGGGTTVTLSSGFHARCD